VATGLILGIESSCDETSAAVVRDGRQVLSNVVSSQLVHADYGGVVPELASREHRAPLCPWCVRRCSGPVWRMRSSMPWP